MGSVSTTRSLAGTASILCILLTLFLDNVGYCFVVPFLPQHAYRLGMSKGMIGLLFGLYGVMLFVGSFVFRRVVATADRRVVLLSGSCGLVGSFALFTRANSMYMLFAARALEGLSGAAIQTAGTSLLKSYYSSEHEDRPMALIFLVMSLGGLLGPPFGGVIHHMGGWETPFEFMAACTLAVAAPAMFVLSENDQRPEHTTGEHLFNRQILGILVAVFLVGYSTTQLEPILPLYLFEHFGTRPITIGCIMMIFTLAHAGSSPAANSLERFLGRVGVSAIGLALSAIFIPMLPLAKSIWVLTAILVATGVSGGLVLAFAMPELADVLASQGHTSHVTVYIMFDSAYACGMVVGSLCGGILFEQGIKYPLISAAVMMLVLAPILYIVSQPSQVGAVTRRPPSYEAVSMLEGDDGGAGDSWETAGRYGADSYWAPASGTTVISDKRDGYQLSDGYVDSFSFFSAKFRLPSRTEFHRSEY